MNRALLALVLLASGCGRRAPEARREPALAELFALGPSDRVVGLDAPVEIRAVPRRPEAAAARVSIRVTGGAPLAEGEASEDGRSFHGRTQRLTPRATGGFGIVPVSRAEQLETELTVRIERAGTAPLEVPLRVQALARAGGLPNVAVGHPLLLAGVNLALTPPLGSHAALRDAGGVTTFTPDLRGSYMLSDALGHRLTIESARYDEVPLDCGRSDCHGAIAASARNSPMTRALASDLGGCHPLSDPSCALRCHATGEPGTDDGGFVDIWREFGEPRLPSDYADLPRALHRAGGVGCLACHGPSAIPRPAESWALLRSSVCAVCHDAPPRYGHVAALAASRMSAADRDPRVRRDPRCASCHTSWGALGARARKPPEDASPLGLGCATCHDVHPHPGGVAVAGEPPLGLLREPSPSPLVDLPEALRTGPSRVCVACHAPSTGAALPEASAAAIVAGRGGLAPESGAALTADAPHARDAKGCLSCHDAGPPGLERGQGHAFAANTERCAACHQPKVAEDLHARAVELELELEPHAARSGPAHAGGAPRLPPARARALFDVRLVLEDPAAAVHNPGYARQLLAAAEATLLPSRPESKP